MRRSNPSERHGATGKFPPIQSVLPLSLLASAAFVGAHYVRLCPGSKAPAGRWKHERPSYGELRLHVDSGAGGAGLVPASVQLCPGEPLTALDVDRGDVGALLNAYPGIATAQTARGWHAYYRHSGPALGNSTWAGPGGTAGDVRSGAGYVALHGNEIGILDEGLISVMSAGRAGRCLGWLPSNLISSPAYTGPGAREAAQTRVADTRAAAGLLGEALRTAKRVEIGGAVVGGRHPAMVRYLTRWAGRRTWSGGRGQPAVPVDAAFLARRAAAAWLGLPDRQTFPEAEIAGILAWVLGVRERIHTEEHRPEWIARQRARARRLGELRSAAAAARHEVIRQAHAAGGVSAGELARRFGVSLRTVRYALASGRGRADPPAPLHPPNYYWLVAPVAPATAADRHGANCPHPARAVA